MTNILREEWGCDGLNITDNVLTHYVNGVDGILAGVSTFDAMLPYITQQLPKYKNDPVVVNAMREASHHNLYAIANSVGMNGVGPDTTITVIEPHVVTAARVFAIVFPVAFVACLAMWIVRRRRFRKEWLAEHPAN